jgi:hypothetical protein
MTCSRPAVSRRPRGQRLALLVAMMATTSLGPSAAQAQDVLPPNRGGFTGSLGVPPSWTWAAGFSAGVHGRDESKLTAHANLGVYHDLLNPMTAALGFLGEAYVGTRGTLSGAGGVDGGGRIGVFSPTVRFAVGADYNTKDNEVDLFVSLIHPFQRGGLLGRGGALRIDYLPGRRNAASVGVRIPLGQPLMGRSRPRQDHVRLAAPEPTPIFLIPDSTLVDALANARSLAHWVNRLTVPFTEHWAWSREGALDAFANAMGELRAHMAGTAGVRSPVQDVEVYHAELERAR